MKKLVHNAHVYDESGNLVQSYDLYEEQLPVYYKTGTYYVLSEHIGGSRSLTLEQLQGHKIAVITNGEYHLDPAEFDRNYQGERL